ncbi:MAG: ferrous iron transporter B [Oscillospiraceae bacterium]|nr:ferrous iron transporter B [Oscillospiraceae bacterium]
MEIKIALAGNPNSGKTTLFNALTGSNQRVGNWPGVTVEKKEGHLKNHKDVIIQDLPGIYSLSPYTMEEVVSRTYLVNEKPDAILDIVDGTNIERNLYLTTQLIELGLPVVVAVNMIDLVEKNGDKVDLEKLGKELGCKVVGISALKGSNVAEAADAAVEAAQSHADIELPHVFTGSVEHAIAHIEESIDGLVDKRLLRWYAIKLFERDEKVEEELNLSDELKEHIEKHIKDCEEELDDDAESIITNQRYAYINKVVEKCLKKNTENENLTLSDRIDRVVTNRILAIPIFVVIMFIVYYISVSSVGGYLTDWANDGLFGDGFHLFWIGCSAYDEAVDEFADEYVFSNEELVSTVTAAAAADVPGGQDLLDSIEDENYDDFSEGYENYVDELDAEGYDISFMEDIMEEEPDPADYGVWVPGIPVLVEDGLNAIGCADWLESLILDGIIGGVGAVLGFVPQMALLFIFLGILEYCGYMSRIAFILDRIFRRFGLSGKSFIPVLIGTGCGVPGIMASRTIENERDRRMTVITTTFIPCGAKLPIIALIATALFHGEWWVAPVAYFIGIAAIIVSGIILKKTRMFAGDPAPFVMELPAYHWPGVGNVLRSMWERCWSFIKRAGTIILVASIVIWAGSTFGVVDGVFCFDVDMELEDSLLGILGGAVCWIFSPLGFGNIRATVATIMGLVAKEEVVGVFGVLDFAGLTALSGFSFLIFNLLCAPCFAAMGAIRREMNSAKWFWFAVGYQCVFAYVIALIVYQFGCAFSGSVNVVGLIVAIILTLFLLYMLFRKNRYSDKAIEQRAVNAASGQ